MEFWPGLAAAPSGARRIASTICRTPARPPNRGDWLAPRWSLPATSFGHGKEVAHRQRDTISRVIGSDRTKPLQVANPVLIRDSKICFRLVCHELVNTLSIFCWRSPVPDCCRHPRAILTLRNWPGCGNGKAFSASSALRAVSTVTCLRDRHHPIRYPQMFGACRKR